jgi:hypothetical protein
LPPLNSPLLLTPSLASSFQPSLYLKK